MSKNISKIVVLSLVIMAIFCFGKNVHAQEATSMATSTIDFNKVYINEILPNPDDTNDASEWIELYNDNSVDIDLSDWLIGDKANPKKYKISKIDIPDTIILAHSFFILEKSVTKIQINNRSRMKSNATST